MKETSMDTGDTGQIILRDFSDGETTKYVNVFARSLSPVPIPNMVWLYSIDGVRSPLRTFNFQNTTLLQFLGTVYVGYSSTFSVHLNNTGTTQMGGPVDLEIDLLNQLRTVSVKLDGVYYKAFPYVKIEGTWLPASPYVMKDGVWYEAK